MIPERYASVTYALFRIVFGFVFLIYGLQKLFGWFGGQQVPLMALIGAAGVIETFGGLLVMIGLFTKPAAFIASGEMAVAYWYIHVAGAAAKYAFPALIVPQHNGGERAAMFCFAFLYIATRGAGIWSVDSALKKPQR